MSVTNIMQCSSSSRQTRRRKELTGTLAHSKGNTRTRAHTNTQVRAHTHTSIYKHTHSDSVRAHTEPHPLMALESRGGRHDRSHITEVLA